MRHRNNNNEEIQIESQIPASIHTSPYEQNHDQQEESARE